MESASIATSLAHEHDEHHGPPAANQSSRVDAQFLGMLLFIISEVMLFGAFFTAYFFIRVVASDPWPQPGLDVLQHVLEPPAVRLDQRRVLRQRVKHERVVGVGRVAQAEGFIRVLRRTVFHQRCSNRIFPSIEPRPAHGRRGTMFQAFQHRNNTGGVALNEVGERD